MARMASSACGCPEEARCLREKRARKRRARGVDSDVRVLRSVRIVGSVGEEMLGSRAEGAMVAGGGESYRGMSLVRPGTLVGKEIEMAF